MQEGKIVVILFGPPGSGKGTQGKMIAEEIGIPHIATGDIMRQAISDGTELGLKVKEFVGKGLLVPDEIVIQIIEERLKKDDTKNGFILDGFPRTIPQAVALDELFQKINIQNYKVIWLDVPDEEIVKRISGRRTCKNCQAVYNIYFNPPKVDGICDVCGGELFIREDDKEEKVKKRLEVFREQTLPLIDYYQKKRRKIIRVSGVGSVDEIKERIKMEIFRE
ncbi:MAG: adenylate kinase [Candidatus Calescibacterium sp.]|jgi:adenylate kinase|nr:adenylate kinase [Candidatus Calescibacterium sp.]